MLGCRVGSTLQGWAAPRVFTENTRIHVKLETEDQVWCGPDPSLACKALELFTKKTSISEAQLRAEFKAFVDVETASFSLEILLQAFIVNRLGQ
jgi:hypothetical protein